MAEKQRLKDKVAVVTGGSRGIGLAIVQMLAQHGCQVVIAGRSAKSLQAAGEALRRMKVETVQCDITDPAQVDNLFSAVRKKHSRIDILVNNAGVAHPLAPVQKLPIESWKQTIDTNLTGMFLCTRAALPLMPAGGTIVNNLSMAAIQPFEGMAAYNASKYGALGFTNVLREELRKQGIRVLALIPGPTDTDIWEQFWPQAPRDKMVSATTVAEAVFHVVTLPASTTIEEVRLRPAIGSLRAENS